VIVLVFGFAGLVLVLVGCTLLARHLRREIAVEDADAVLRSEYERVDPENQSCTRR